MALPYWTVHYLKRSLDGVTEQIRHPETLQRFRESAAEMLGEFPDTAARGLDRVLGQAKATVVHAREWAKCRVAVQTPAINALGRLVDPAVSGPPQADAALAAAIQFAGSFSAQHTDANERLQRQLRRGISVSGCPLPRGTDMALASGLEAALIAVAAWARARSRTVIIPRCAAIGLADGVALPEILDAAGATLREVGPNDHMTAEDWKRTRVDKEAIILMAGEATPESLPADCADATVVRLLTLGTLGDSPAQIAPPVPTAVGAVRDDRVDLVILPGDGLIGGPPCGLIIGCQHAISAITRTPSWSGVAAAPMTRLMLAAGLMADAKEKSPVEALVATSVENLQHRAERLMMRIGGEETPIDGEIADQPASIARNQPYLLPSRQLELRRDDLSAEPWARALASQCPAVLADPQDDRLIIDLRWVRPCEDAALAEALLRTAGESTPEEFPAEA